jgi:hypothetical protein
VGMHRVMVPGRFLHASAEWKCAFCLFIVDLFIIRARAQCSASETLDAFTVLTPLGYLRFALALQLSLLLFPQLLVNLCTFAGLVAMCTSGQSGVFLSALLVEGNLLTLLLALLFTL